MPIPVFSKWYIVFKKGNFEDSKGVIRSLNWRRQTIQWPKEIRQAMIYKTLTLKTKEWATRNLPRTRDELGCYGRVGSSCSTCTTLRVTLVTNTVIIYEWGKDKIVITTKEKYQWSFLTHIYIYRNG